MSFKSIRYKTNFITQVICRVDFVEIIKNDEIFDQAIVSEITKHFTRREMDQVLNFSILNVDVPANVFSGQNYNGIKRTYTSTDGKNKIILSNKFLVAEFNSYLTFEDFKDKFKNIVYAIFREKKNNTERTGIRFINLFDSEKMRINKNMFVRSVANALTPIIEPDINKIVPIRSMHLTEYTSEDINIHFRFGLYNKLYPGKINSNDFVLDFDCFSNERFQNSEDVLRCIDSGHDHIQYLFENSITDKLRTVMDNE